MRDTNLIIDCFAGGGGASVGIEMAIGRSVDIAVNHDPQAIRMHTVNHPKTLHLTEDIFEVDLQKHVGGRHVALMWASPDCTQFSKAKGGKPRVSGIRMLPWAVYKHAKAVQPDVIIMENVEEIQQWGPLDENGRPIKEKIGEEYSRFISAVKGLGYAFDSRELIAADYGAPTTRKRWYAIFRRDGRPITWPQQSHFRDAEPLHTITTSPGHFGVISAFLVKYYGQGCGQQVSEPLATITTKDRFGLVNVLLTIDGQKYVISDIFLRMLKPTELKVMQGFPNDYIIGYDLSWRKMSVAEQVAKIGNSVSPPVAKALVEANCAYLKEGERKPIISFDRLEKTG